MIGVRRNPVKAKPGRKVLAEAMLELPDFAPLHVTRSRRVLSRGALDSLDHLLIVGTKRTGARTLQRIPQGRQLAILLARALARGEDFASTRATNARGTRLTIAAFSPGSTFATLTWARKLIAECTREKPAALGVVIADSASDDAARAACAALVAAAAAAAFDLPTFKTMDAAASRLRSLRLLGTAPAFDLDVALAQALGNNVARWF